MLINDVDLTNKRSILSKVIFELGTLGTVLDKILGDILIVINLDLVRILYDLVLDIEMRLTLFTLF
jgi:hypothetical protein